jgi:hypothetical protein
MPRKAPTKSDFIRSMGEAKPVDIVKAAAAKGIKLTPSFVYAIRAMDKKRNGKAGTKRAHKTEHNTGGVEATIRKLAWEHGLLAVEAAVKAVRAQAEL